MSAACAPTRVYPQVRGLQWLLIFFSFFSPEIPHPSLNLVLPCYSQCRYFCSKTQSWWANQMRKMLGMNRPLVTVVLTSIYLPQKKKKSTPCQEDLLRVSDVFHDIKILLFPFHPSLTELVSPCIGTTSNSLNSALFWMKSVLTSCCREPLDKHLYFVCVCLWQRYNSRSWEAPSDHIHWSACGSCSLLNRDRSHLCPPFILYGFFFNSTCWPCHLFSHSHSFPKYIPFLSGSLILIFWPFVLSFQLCLLRCTYFFFF